MRTELIKILVCPKCSSSLKLKSKKQSMNRVLMGRLMCTRCNIGFGIIDGIVCFKSTRKQDKVRIRKARGMFRKELKEEWLRHYQKQEARALKREWKWMIHKLNLKQSKIHLDWATGTGRFLKQILNRAKGEVVVLEMDYATCAGLRWLLEKIGKYSKVSVICGDARNMPFKDNSFHSISSWHGLDEPKIAKALNESRRILKKNRPISTSGFFIEKPLRNLQIAKKEGMKFVEKNKALQYFQKIGFKNIDYQIFFEGKWLGRKDFLPKYGDKYAIYAISGKK